MKSISSSVVAPRPTFLLMISSLLELFAAISEAAWLSLRYRKHQWKRLSPTSLLVEIQSTVPFQDHLLMEAVIVGPRELSGHTCSVICRKVILDEERKERQRQIRIMGNLSPETTSDGITESAQPFIGDFNFDYHSHEQSLGIHLDIDESCYAGLFRCLGDFFNQNRFRVRFSLRPSYDLPFGKSFSITDLYYPGTEVLPAVSVVKMIERIPDVVESPVVLH